MVLNINCKDVQNSDSMNDTHNNLNIHLGTVLVSGSKEECLLSIRILEELFPTH